MSSGKPTDDEVTMDESEQKDEAKTVYKFTCRWTILSRGCLLNIEEMTSKWVQTENTFRSMLNAHTKKEFDISDVSFLTF